MNQNQEEFPLSYRIIRTWVYLLGIILFLTFIMIIISDIEKALLLFMVFTLPL